MFYIYFIKYVKASKLNYFAIINNIKYSFLIYFNMSHVFIIRLCYVFP